MVKEVARLNDGFQKNLSNTLEGLNMSLWQRRNSAEGKSIITSKRVNCLNNLTTIETLTDIIIFYCSQMYRSERR